MRLPPGVVLPTPHAALSTLPPTAYTSTTIALSWTTRRRQSFGIHHLHPQDTAPEGVPSSLFTFRKRPSSYPMQESGDKDGNHDCHADDSAKTRTVNLDDLPLQAGLIDESDLEGVATLLIECFPQGAVLAEGDFSELETMLIGAPLEMTNKYLDAVFYSLKARCGDRLSRGDFALTSDSVVLAVQDHAHETADGGRAIIAVVELQLRVPDGSLPSDFPFRAPWRPAKPRLHWEPYMCNLAVDARYRGQGFGRQLVRLCEHVAKNHWGYQRMHLHVNLDDNAANRLYNSMGYESLPQYDAPRWMRQLFGMPLIRCKVKAFKYQRSIVEQA